jgi:hypothetical protein
MNPTPNSMTCLLKLLVIVPIYNDNINKEGENKYSKKYDTYCTELYQLLMTLPKEDLLDFKSTEAERWIPILVTYFESKEEYEKCANLHKVGYNIFNTIV